MKSGSFWLVLIYDVLGERTNPAIIDTGSTVLIDTRTHQVLTNLRKNNISSKKITFITPHQISTDAKALIRAGVPNELFVKEIVGKGYTDGSKQLDQVVDLELYIHKVYHKRKWYLSIQRGKHRGTRPIEEDRMYLLLPFPKGMPIPDDINTDPIHLKELPTGNDSDSFSF